MPISNYDESKPTVYLDWSHFVNAYEGSLLSCRPICKEYHELLFFISNKANLCFSFNHFAELFNIGDAEEQKNRAAWLDCLNLVPIRNECQVKKLERAILVEKLGFKNYFDKCPFSNSMFDAFFSKITIEQSVGLLRCKSILDCVNGCIKSGLKITKPGQVMVEMSKRLHSDENFCKEKKIKEEDILKRRQEKHLQGLLEDILMDESALKKNILEKGVSSKIGECLKSENFMTNNMPLLYLNDLVTYNYKKYVSNKKNLDSDKNKQIFASTYYDFAHLVGAAYCNIFTCDTRINKLIGEGRSNIGRQEQIAGTDEQVLEKIKSQF